MKHPSFSLVLIYLLLFLAIPVQGDINPLLRTSSEYQEVAVERVLAVDRIMISGGKSISLIGIAGPPPPKKKYAKRDERGFTIQEEDPTTSLEDKAFRYASGLMLGKTVRLEFDVERRNTEDDLLAYVYLPDGTMANTELLRMGYADLKLRSPNTKYTEQFRAAYREARREMRGLQGQW